MVALLPSALAAASLAAAATAAATLNVVKAVPNPLPDYIGENLGAYSPYAPAGEYPAVPKGCTLTQVNILQRHGVRFPTASAGKKIAASVAKLQKASSFAQEVAFVPGYTYDLGADDLTAFGAYQSYAQGQLHHSRYHALTSSPFIRSDSSARVVASAGNWSAGFALATNKAAAPTSVVMDDADGLNDTLDDNACDAAPDLSAYEDEWASIFLATPTARLNALAPGANLTVTDSLYFLELCGFQSLYDGKLSDWCGLFTPQEYEDFNYYMSLDKYYGNGYGQSLGPIQGVGYVNELVSRLTNDRSYVLADETQVNQTLDSSPATFPLGRKLYADFSHDNQITSILAAIGLKKDPAPLAATGPRAGQVWVTSEIVPFGGNLVTERLTCAKKEYVRLLINDELQVPTFCKGYNKKTGLCSVANFVASQAYSTGNGNGEFAQCA